MRLSRPDENDPTKRRHFEISIDSPFNIMSCRATQANMSLPAYDQGVQATSLADEFDCGCPGAAMRRRGSPPLSAQTVGAAIATANLSVTAPTPTRSWTNDSGGLAPPRPAHIHNDPHQGAPRPMHLLRNPSFNPPAFDADDPPPPLVTPPPLYDNIVPGDRNALADYFARLADEMGDEEEHDGPARIDYPLTPGGRVNRSMDISRNWMPLGSSVPNMSQPPARTSVAL